MSQAEFMDITGAPDGKLRWTIPFAWEHVVAGWQSRFPTNDLFPDIESGEEQSRTMDEDSNIETIVVLIRTCTDVPAVLAKWFAGWSIQETSQIDWTHKSMVIECVNLTNAASVLQRERTELTPSKTYPGHTDVLHVNTLDIRVRMPGITRIAAMFAKKKFKAMHEIHRPAYEEAARRCARKAAEKQTGKLAAASEPSGHAAPPAATSDSAVVAAEDS